MISSVALAVTTVGLAAPAYASATAEAGGEAVVTRFDSGLVTYQAAPLQNNDVQVFLDGGRLVVSDVAPMTAGPGCSEIGQNLVDCGAGVAAITIGLGDQDDELRHEAPIPSVVVGGAGNDLFHAGLVRGGDSRISYGGDTGFDTVSYASADRFVVVTMGAGTADDGRPDDADTVEATIEKVVGSPFPDQLTGDDADNVLVGGAAADVLVGNGGRDTFDEGRFGSGADDIDGGPDFDTVLYADRSADITVDLDGVADDGQFGELDNVRGSVEMVVTGSGDDVIKGNKAGNRFDGGAGDDLLVGKGGADILLGEAGGDRLEGGGGADQILAVDGAADRVLCGGGHDAASVDLIDVAKKCEDTAAAP